MRRVTVSFAMLLFLMLSSVFLPASAGAPVSGSGNAASPTIDPALLSAEGDCRVVAVVKDLPMDAILADLDGLFLTLHLSPVIFGCRFATGVLASGASGALGSCISLSYIGLDSLLYGGASLRDAITISRQQKPSFEELFAAICSLSTGSSTSYDALSGGASTSMAEASSIIRSSDVWALGIDGSGITIAVIDTGVDFASPGLGYWNDSMSRDGNGLPSSLDADAQCVALTNITLQSYSSGGRVFIRTAGLDPTIYLWGYGYSFSEIAGKAFPSNMEVTGIVPAGITCHFGVMVQVGYGNMGRSAAFYPVLIVDKDRDSLFETAYVDLSSAYYSQSPDYSFSDEAALTVDGNLVAARDFTHDKILDISAGSLGRFLDVWGVSPNACDRGGVLLPIDPAGNYASFIVDLDGHGTMCANTAAARNVTQATGVSNPYWFPGVAPGASIMSITSLTMSDIIEGELWACGFDLLPVNLASRDVESYGTVYGLWTYTGEHKADIVSNSWGISESMRDLYGYPWYSIICCLQDCLSIPGYIDPSYPGTLFLQSSGNGAPGYGTVTDPAYSFLTLTVGATTSLNFSTDTYGFAGGYADDVIPWSGRGPTPAGYIKPDVVSVGMGGYVPTEVNYGHMSGLKAYALFSGTSMSCPMTAGAAALVAQAYLSANGEAPDPMTVKAMLKSSAADLGYDAFLQGSGRVDCAGAVGLAMGTEGIMLKSSASYDNIAQYLSHAWAFSNAYLGETPSTPPQGPLFDSSWFAGYVAPGSSSSATLILSNPAFSLCEVELEPQYYSLLEGGSFCLNGSTGDLPEEWRTNPEYGFGVGTIVSLPLNGISLPSNADIMTVQLSYPFTYFDDDGDYSAERRIMIFILDWIDYNSDGRCTPDECWLVTCGENIGSTVPAAVSFPSCKFQGQPVILVSQATGPSLVPYQIQVRFWSRSDWSWITLSSSLVEVAPRGTLAVTATMTIPPSATQGVYEGLILASCSCEGSDARTVAFPVSVAVPQLIDGNSLVVPITPASREALLYDPYSVGGLFDWGWRYESGDWKAWLVELPQDPEIIAAFVICNWSGEWTDIDLFSINSSWMIWDATDTPGNSNYWYNGIFRRETRSGGSYEWVSLSPEAGVHTVLMHNVLFNGDPSEAVEGALSLVKLSGLLHPISLRSGSYVSLPVNLSTGFTLTGLSARLSKVGALPDGVGYSISPSRVDAINATAEGRLTLSISIPSGAEEGSYSLKLTLGSDQFALLPELPSVTIDLVIDNTPPALSLSSPINGSILFDALPPILINFTDAGSGTNPYTAVLTIDGADVTNSSTLTDTSVLYVPESPLADGQHSVSLQISDNAGNTATASWSFTVDTTPPAVAGLSPAPASFVNSTMGIIMAECSDAVSGIDPDSLSLLVDSADLGAIFDSSCGCVLCAFAGLADGQHSVSLQISDNAGNTATASWSFTVDTTPPQINYT
ncbi:MAG TPA: S8 family serine peptidase [Candidatus Methanomethylicus sp.]|nr:S8 family serine peptidase [Candidatus Methanomethylicus sp.]